MIFNSTVFIFIFLPVCVIVYSLIPSKLRSGFLLLSSILFLLAANPKNFLIILFSMFFNYFMAIAISKQQRVRARSSLFMIAVMFNISMLFIYKYLAFFIGNINAIFKSTMYVDKIITPLGLSFFTFQVISYLADVYKLKYKADRNIKDVFLYFIMFPNIASGPIMRYDELKPQMGEKKINYTLLGHGTERFIIGLFKKVVIANTLSSVWTDIKMMDTASMSAMTGWIGILAFTMYIYFDFSGYMDMAIGVANMFGYKLRENFDFPYIAKSVSEFWRRWHMTLGRWFKDYIYIPLGGSRNGTKVFIIASTVVWITTGLWHGASWNFIVWGLYFGLFVILEKLVLNKFLEKLPSILRNTYTMIVVMIGWVIFDTESLRKAFSYIKSMLGFTRILFDNTGLYYFTDYFMYFLLALILCRPLFPKMYKAFKSRMNNTKIVINIIYLMVLFLISIAYMLNQNYSPSMYIGF